MPIKQYKPTSPARRFHTVSDFVEITKIKPEKALLKKVNKSGGRNCHGHITCRHLGGGKKRKFRVIDFIRDKLDIPAKVAAIEYDPNRSARIALINYADGKKSYIVSPLDLKVGDTIIKSEKADIITGNNLPLYAIPLGTIDHNIELKKGKGGQIARSAGVYGQILAKEKEYVHIRLPSGEVRLFHKDCSATIGQVSNPEHEIISLGKAGRSRWLGIRPTVRGVAMNPIDHPLGGGEGKTSGGRHPCTPWGVPTKGYKTRKKGKVNSRFIIKRRKG